MEGNPYDSYPPQERQRIKDGQTRLERLRHQLENDPIFTTLNNQIQILVWDFVDSARTFQYGGASYDPFLIEVIKEFIGYLLTDWNLGTFPTAGQIDNATRIIHSQFGGRDIGYKDIGKRAVVPNPTNLPDNEMTKSEMKLYIEQKRLAEADPVGKKYPSTPGNSRKKKQRDDEEGSEGEKKTASGGKKKGSKPFKPPSYESNDPLPDPSYVGKLGRYYKGSNIQDPAEIERRLDHAYQHFLMNVNPFDPEYPKIVTLLERYFQRTEGKQKWVPRTDINYNDLDVAKAIVDDTQQTTKLIDRLRNRIMREGAINQNIVILAREVSRVTDPDLKTVLQSDLDNVRNRLQKIIEGRRKQAMDEKGKPYPLNGYTTRDERNQAIKDLNLIGAQLNVVPLPVESKNAEKPPMPTPQVEQKNDGDDADKLQEYIDRLLRKVEEIRDAQTATKYDEQIAKVAEDYNDNKGTLADAMHTLQNIETLIVASIISEDSLRAPIPPPININNNNYEDMDVDIGGKEEEEPPLRPPEEERRREREQQGFIDRINRGQDQSTGPRAPWRGRGKKPAWLIAKEIQEETMQLRRGGTYRYGFLPDDRKRIESQLRVAAQNDVNGDMRDINAIRQELQGLVNDPGMIKPPQKRTRKERKQVTIDLVGETMVRDKSKPKLPWKQRKLGGHLGALENEIEAKLRARFGDFNSTAEFKQRQREAASPTSVPTVDQVYKKLKDAEAEREAKRGVFRKSRAERGLPPRKPNASYTHHTKTNYRNDRYDDQVVSQNVRYVNRSSGGRKKTTKEILASTGLNFKGPDILLAFPEFQIANGSTKLTKPQYDSLLDDIRYNINTGKLLFAHKEAAENNKKMFSQGGLYVGMRVIPTKNWIVNKWQQGFDDFGVEDVKSISNPGIWEVVGSEGTMRGNKKTPDERYLYEFEDGKRWFDINRITTGLEKKEPCDLTSNAPGMMRGRNTGQSGCLVARDYEGEEVDQQGNIHTEINIPEDDQSALIPATIMLPGNDEAQAKPAKCLIDTGAAFTELSVPMAKALGLYNGKQEVSNIKITLSNKTTYSTYRATIWIHIDRKDIQHLLVKKRAVNNPHLMFAIDVVYPANEDQKGNRDVDLLIGRNGIKQMNLVLR